MLAWLSSAVADDQRRPITRLAQAPGEVLDVAVAVDEGLGAGEPAAVDDAGVVELVGEDDAVATGERRDRADVGQVAGAEQQRRLVALERRQSLLQPDVRLHVARDQPRGAGAGASRLISGNMEPHVRLEERLAAFKGYEAALLFGSGYLANIGTIAALAGRDGVVFSDELNHASIVDGCRLARAETFVYRHGDVEHLAWGLGQAGDRAALIVSDGVFSMDGDVAPLED